MKIKHPTLLRLALWSALSMSMAILPLKADEFSDTVRNSVPKYQNAIVNVKLVIKLKTGKQDRDIKVEVKGTVIDPTGLTVVSSVTIDPAAAMRSDPRLPKGPGSPSIESDISETTLVLPDGTEVDAHVVLKDSDLDVAFIRPKESGKKFDFISPVSTKKLPQLMDDLFVINRMTTMEDRAAIVSTGKIRSVIKGPRSYFICDDDVAKNLSCIAFNSSGNPLALVVTKKSATNTIAILRPLEDLESLIAQAKEAKPPEKKASEGEETAPAKPESKE